MDRYGKTRQVVDRGKELDSRPVSSSLCFSSVAFAPSLTACMPNLQRRGTPTCAPRTASPCRPSAPTGRPRAASDVASGCPTRPTHSTRQRHPRPPCSTFNELRTEWAMVSGAERVQEIEAALRSVVPQPTHQDHPLACPPGSTLPLFTDGLVEHHKHPLDTGLTHLTRRGAPRRPPARRAVPGAGPGCPGGTARTMSPSSRCAAHPRGDPARAGRARHGDGTRVEHPLLTAPARSGASIFDVPEWVTLRQLPSERGQL